ncbi:MAG TPA: bifunctional DNA-formamidopyrimidine glycosylase/DNA-(apurinic or apyrimidinic site) lyase [Candidatus Acidoferrales bacterium]|nr:bifunctional DNA-formamidopyrimidine glycosylase/DNA-(apurinic or apyrimidinic site) lyase [Candidatus Acidoferrales bacterium]
MPELPEVETVAADLRPQVVGARIVGCQLSATSLVRLMGVREFCAGVVGARITALGRRGKYLLFGLLGGRTLVVHLGMTGQLTVAPSGVPAAAHTHLALALEGGTELRLRDPRRFGRVLLGFEADLIAAGAMPRLGPEPIDPKFSGTLLRSRLEGRRAAIKTLLLDQTIVAGVGNIYADEALFRSRIHPARSAGDIGPRRLGRLAQALAATLQEAIENRGSTVSDYRDGHGQRGRQQDSLQVYGRAGLPCPRCGQGLRSLRLGGRSSVFCSRCQR